MFKNKNNKKYILTIIILLILAGALYLYFNRTDNNEEVAQPTAGAQTTSTAPSAQETFNDGNDRGEPGNTLNEDKGSATVDDNSGRIKDRTDPDKWTFSKSGDVTVYSPTYGQSTKSGDQISGKTNLSSISFRIIDDASGVIATGKLKVVQGQFSGTIDFESNADKGRIDIFGTLDSGKEFSNVEIPVKFK